MRGAFAAVQVEGRGVGSSVGGGEVWVGVSAMRSGVGSARRGEAASAALRCVGRTAEDGRCSSPPSPLPQLYSPLAVGDGGSGEQGGSSHGDGRGGGSSDGHGRLPRHHGGRLLCRHGGGGPYRMAAVVRLPYPPSPTPSLSPSQIGRRAKAAWRRGGGVVGFFLFTENILACGWL